MNALNLIRNISSEISVDAQNVRRVSIKGVAILCGRTPFGLHKRLVSSENARSELNNYLETQGEFSYVSQLMWVHNGIPESAVMMFLEFYMFINKPANRMVSHHYRIFIQEGFTTALNQYFEGQFQSVSKSTAHIKQIENKLKLEAVQLHVSCLEAELITLKSLAQLYSHELHNARLQIEQLKDTNSN